MTVATRTASIAGTIALAAGLGLTGAVAANAQDSKPNTGQATASSGVSVRQAPSVHAKRLGVAHKGQGFVIECQVPGKTVDGFGTWYKLNRNLGWVSARYVGTLSGDPSSCTDSKAEGRNSQGIALNLRAGPTTDDKIVGSLAANGKVKLICKVKGESVRGNSLWYQTSDRKWVTARYIDNVGKAPSYC